MVDVVSTVSSSQNTSLKQNVQSSSVASAPPQASSSSVESNVDFVTSCIYVDNLQNVAILEYRSSQTGQVVQQYPNQAQINAFKAAQQLAHQAGLKQESAPAPDVHQAPVQSAAPDQVATTAPAPSTGSSGSSGGKTTSIIA